MEDTSETKQKDPEKDLLKDPLAFLKTEIASKDEKAIQHAFHGLGILASALGPIKVRDCLLPYLASSEMLENVENCESLAVLADILGDFVEEVGGPDFACDLLSPLENLCAFADEGVRTAAVHSLIKIAPDIPADDLAHRYMQTFRRLAHGEDYSCRISAGLQLIPLYNLVSEVLQEELRFYMSTFAHDEVPQVRKVAFDALPTLCRHLTVAQLQSDVLPLLYSLDSVEEDHMGDETTSNVVKSLPVLAGAFELDKYEEIVLPLAVMFGRHTVSFFRQSLACCMADLCAASGAIQSNEHLVPIYADLLTDEFPEVRAAVIANLASVCRVVDRISIMTHMLTSITELPYDEDQQVRLLCALKLPELCKLGDDEFTIEILPVVLSMARDASWRVRLEITKQLTSLASILGREVYAQKLCEFIVLGFKDVVDAVRQTAAQQFVACTNMFSVDFMMKQQQFHLVTDLLASKNYIHRIVAVNAMQGVALLMQSEPIEQLILPHFFRICEKDPILNVRLVTYKAITALIPFLDETLVHKKVLSVVTTQKKKENDVDALDFLDEALNLCECESHK